GQAPDDVRSAGDRRIPAKQYRIGELVDYAGVSRQTIHNYTAMGLLHERGWSRGGHRLYDESAFSRVDQILRMRQQRKSMQEIREFFWRMDASS
ncbi:MAG: MerR family transcriptional regulator, partial [Gemmatimonadales bacterium]